jgi:hypothetical protein
MVPFGETGHAVGEQTIRRKRYTMGDKSPKATSKHATQKKTKTNQVIQKKKTAIAAKQTAVKKK